LGAYVPVRRYMPDLSAPLPYSNTGNDAVTNRFYFEASYAQNTHRGLAVGWQGQIAVSMRNETVYGHDNNAIYLFPDTGYMFPETSFAGGTPIITGGGNWTSGVKFDAAGNIYMGTTSMPRIGRRTRGLRAMSTPLALTAARS